MCIQRDHLTLSHRLVAGVLPVQPLHAERCTDTSQRQCTFTESSLIRAHISSTCDSDVHVLTFGTELSVHCQELTYESDH